MKRFFWSLALAVVLVQSAFGVEHLKQSTAVTIKFGPFVDAADGVTAEGSLTLSQADFRLSKNGGNIAQKNDATAGTHDELGFYDVPLDATDTNTLGRLLIAVSETGALPVWKEYMVLPANVYDSLYGSDRLEVDVTTWNGTAVATPDTAGYPKVTIKDGTGTGEIDTTSGGVALATGQEIEVADADLRSALGMAAADLDTQLDAIVADTNELQTDWVNGGRLDLILDDILLDTGTTLQAEVDGIQADTEDIQSRLPAALVSGRIDASVGAMASGVVTASAVATNAIDADAVATDAQGEFAAGVWNALTASYVAADSFGEAFSTNSSLIGDINTATGNTDSVVSNMSAVVDAIVADTNELQTDWVNGGRLDLLVDAIKAITDQFGAAQAEPTGVPAANETPLDKLAYVFMMLRNKITVTADTKTYFDDGGAAEFKKGLTDDGTTYTEAEAAAP